MNNTTTSAPIFAKQVLPAVLRLTLTKKWFDMIASGEKKEEYRELKKYWQVRLTDGIETYLTEFLPKGFGYKVKWKHFDYVEFKNGYAKNAPLLLVECKGIDIDKAKAKWSDGFKDDCFVIRLGNIVMSRA